jgi:hypothetical protein
MDDDDDDFDPESASLFNFDEEEDESDWKGNLDESYEDDEEIDEDED